MTIPEASKESGFAPDTIRRFIRAGKFLASMPRGRRGGWVINSATFRDFIADRERATRNAWGQAQ